MHAVAVFQTDEISRLLIQLQGLLGGEGLKAAYQETVRRMERLFVLAYPPQSHAPLPKQFRWADGTMHKFKSLKHQRGFFAALARGKAHVPYRRTGNLARAPKLRLTIQGLLAIVIVYIEQDVYKFVVGSVDQQSAYFRLYTRWKPLQTMVEAQAAQIAEILKTALETIIKDLIRV